MDTIFAEATPPGRGGVSIIRLSGPDAHSIMAGLAGALPPVRQARLRTLREGDEDLDEALVLIFAAGSSFTGEAAAELQLHGAPVVVRRVGAALMRAGARAAEPGEFTRRAFMNGRLDLTEVEGLADLLEAETEQQRRSAVAVASGGLRRKAEAWRADLVRAGALIEASVDFADEDVPDLVPAEAMRLMSGLRSEWRAELAGSVAAERRRTGFTVAIIGPPNAGKSSLLNAIARREVAIVTPVAGTTRDIIELRLDLNGMAVTLLDTAGLRVAGDEIEAIGIARAEARAREADVRIHLSDTGAPVAALWQSGDLAVRGRADRATENPVLDRAHAISNLDGQGIDTLLKALADRLAEKIAGAGLASHERQISGLSRALAALQDVERLAGQPELLAESVRDAATAIDALLGRIGAEDYLDVIFSSFCIGK